MWDDMRQLIRVRTVDTPEALMLSPSEAYFVRENLKLRLLNARLALLSRNEGTFRDDLGSAQQMLEATSTRRRARPSRCRRCCARSRPTTSPSRCRTCRKA
jgi:predicted Zn-ribbon and HTH transcriptional regulator